MRPLGIAIWLITPEKKVLLQQKRLEKSREEITYYQPIEGWVGSNERVEERKRSLIKEEFGEAFVHQYPTRQLTEIRKINFPIIGTGMAIRHHFLGPLTAQQLAIISSFEKFRLVGKKDLPKIKKLSETDKDPKEDIALFKENWEILLDILGVKGE